MHEAEPEPESEPDAKMQASRAFGCRISLLYSLYPRLWDTICPLYPRLWDTICSVRRGVIYYLFTTKDLSFALGTLYGAPPMLGNYNGQIIENKTYLMARLKQL